MLNEEATKTRERANSIPILSLSLSLTHSRISATPKLVLTIEPSWQASVNATHRALLMKLYLKKTYGLFYFSTHPKNVLWVFEELPEPHM
jgi:hypothetical protein